MPFLAWFCSSVLTPSKVKAPTSTRSTQASRIQMKTADTVGRWNPPDCDMPKKTATTAQPIHRHAPGRNRKACRKPTQVKNANHGLRMVSAAMKATRPGT